MDNNTIPPLQDDTAFLQLPFTQPVIPYNDLHVTGTPERTLLLQDDLPMTMSVMTAKGTLQQRLVTQNDDGGVNVHVVNTSGGGGGGTPAQFHQQGVSYDLQNDGTGSTTITLGTVISQLFMYTLAACILPPIDANATSGFLEISIDAQSLPGTKINLAAIPFCFSPKGTPQAPMAGHVVKYFNPPIDVAYCCGGASADLTIRNNTHTLIEYQLWLGFA